MRQAELGWDIHWFLASKLGSPERLEVQNAMRTAASRLIDSLGRKAVSRKARRELGLPAPSNAVRMGRALGATLWA